MEQEISAKSHRDRRHLGNVSRKPVFNFSTVGMGIDTSSLLYESLDCL